MTYEDALKIGSKIDGYVKCTFALIYGNGVKFSVQHRVLTSHYAQYDYVRDNANAYFEGGEMTDAPDEYAAFWETEGAGKDYGSTYNEYGLNAEYNFQISLDVPLLTAALEAKQKDGYIPVKLTAEAARIIAQVAHRHQRNKYYVYRVFDSEKRYGSIVRHEGDRELVLETYTKPNMDSPDWAPQYRDVTSDDVTNNSVVDLTNKLSDNGIMVYHYELVTTPSDSESYTWLQEACADYKNAIWYVKPGAIDWIPTRVDNVTVTGADGKEIKLDVAIDEARQKMENAKSLLIAAGAASLIL